MPHAYWIGWLSSAILLLTLGKQVHKQWREGRSEGVSIWLFVGQMAASVGFLAYSILVSNWVFTVTNALLVANGATGYWITWRNQRRSRGDAPGASRPNARPGRSAAQGDAESRGLADGVM
jgi:MtN3 and saliva related transmembrane protein